MSTESENLSSLRSKRQKGVLKDWEVYINLLFFSNLNETYTISFSYNNF